MISSPCKNCDMRGKVITQFEEDEKFPYREIDCPVCKGTGMVGELEAKDIGKGDIKTEYFQLSREKAEALCKFLIFNGYISHEFHPLIHEIWKDLNKFLGE